jgi:hypothetical protein
MATSHNINTWGTPLLGRRARALAAAFARFPGRIRRPGANPGIPFRSCPPPPLAEKKKGKKFPPRQLLPFNRRQQITSAACVVSARGDPATPPPPPRARLRGSVSSSASRHSPSTEKRGDSIQGGEEEQGK